MRGIESIARTPQEHVENKGATARRLLSELGPYRRGLFLVFVLVVLGALAQAGGPWLIGRAIDEDILGGNPMGLFRTMFLLLTIYATGALAQRSQIRQIGAVGQSVLASLRARVFERLQHLPLGYFDRRPVGDLMSRVTNDVDTLNQLLSQGLTQLLGSLFSLLGIVVAMLVLDIRLALVCFTIIPTMLFVTSFFARRARKAFRTTRETVGSVTAGLQEEIVGVREAQAFNRTEENIERFRERNAANRAANVQAVAITSAFAPTIDVLSTLATAVVIGYGGYQGYAGPPSGGVPGAVLNFAYEPAHPVLEDVSFIVEPGQTVALVGATGAGKTTIANLIPRFYDVTSGSVRVDGRDVREVSRGSLRANIATVLQEPLLFSGTIAENIGYGRAGDEKPATREEIESAARAAQAHGFISELPDGYDTILGEGGGSLSQGQRQLLSFARAVLADPRILILDEATSNVDTRTETLIQEALRTLLKGRTSVVIAHRLSTIRNADLILVIEDGNIAERGSHAELIEQNGLYADLYRRQFREHVPSGGRS